jgi:hypothetical protein
MIVFNRQRKYTHGYNHTPSNLETANAKFRLRNRNIAFIVGVDGMMWNGTVLLHPLIGIPTDKKGIWISNCPAQVFPFNFQGTTLVHGLTTCTHYCRVSDHSRQVKAELYSKRVFQLKDLGCFFTKSPLKVTVLMLSLTAMVFRRV